MLTLDYERFIVKEIKGLPPESLAEIAHFVYFIRQRVKQPQLFELILQAEADTPLQNFTLGEHLVAGLQDIVAGKTTAVTTQAELKQHLDSVL